MSKIMLSASIGLVGAFSKGASLRGTIAVIPYVIIERLQSKCCDKLKYVHRELRFYKHVRASPRKSKKFIQNYYPKEIY